MLKRLKGWRTAAAATAVIAVALVAGLAAVNFAQAAVSSLGASSATIAVGGTANISVDAVATAPGIGAYTVDVAYDNTKVTATACTSNPVGVCNVNPGGESKVRFTGASAGGLVGNVNLGAIT